MSLSNTTQQTPDAGTAVQDRYSVLRLEAVHGAQDRSSEKRSFSVDLTVERDEPTEKENVDYGGVLGRVLGSNRLQHTLQHPVDPRVMQSPGPASQNVAAKGNTTGIPIGRLDGIKLRRQKSTLNQTKLSQHHCQSTATGC